MVIHVLVAKHIAVHEAIKNMHSANVKLLCTPPCMHSKAYILKILYDQGICLSLAIMVCNDSQILTQFTLHTMDLNCL